jgi:hypothetical protein
MVVVVVVEASSCPSLFSLPTRTSHLDRGMDRTSPSIEWDQLVAQLLVRIVLEASLLG